MREAARGGLQLAVEIAREGREGRKIGTLFVVGDIEAVLERSQPLLLDPLYGHPRELLDVGRPEFRETVKELAQLDGAFLVDERRDLRRGRRYIAVDPETHAACPASDPSRRGRLDHERTRASRSSSRRARSCASMPRARFGPRSFPSCS